MENVRYEAVFGDMAQFTGMMPDCEFSDGTYGYKITNDRIYYCERYNEKYGWSVSQKIRTNFNPMAMRRIIKVPTWTKADQLAGKLPEVGAKCRQSHKDEMSRHRGAKPPRRYGLLGEISLLSPG